MSMAAPYLGGLRITGAEWLSATSISVSFSTTWGAAYFYQLYAGRTLIGATSSRTQRRIVGQLVPTEWPQFLQVLAVDPSRRSFDYGSYLPPRPYNRVRVSFTASSWPADSKVISVAAGLTPDGDVDPSNIVGRALFDKNRVYSVLTEPLGGSGTWNLEVFGRDNRLADGNTGESLAMAAEVIATPPDVTLDPSTFRRFSVDISSGVAGVSFTIPEGG